VTGFSARSKRRSDVSSRRHGRRYTGLHPGFRAWQYTLERDSGTRPDRSVIADRDALDAIGHRLHGRGIGAVASADRTALRGRAALETYRGAAAAEALEVKIPTRGVSSQAQAQVGASGIAGLGHGEKVAQLSAAPLVSISRRY
jgi:hypothetical protein